MSVHGPNGFLRAFRGPKQGPGVTVRADYDPRADEVTLTFTNAGSDDIRLTVADAYTSGRTSVTLQAGQSVSKVWSVSRTRGWYDLTVTGDTGVSLRYAGHLENGRDSISDPAMGGLI